jgi:hypothetical protein
MCVYDINICKDDEDVNYTTLQKALYIGEGGQVTTPIGRSPSGGPEWPPYCNRNRIID